MSHTLSVSVVTVGRIDTDDLGSHDIRDGQIEVDDIDVARELVRRYRAVDWLDDPETETETDDDADESEVTESADSDDGDAPIDPGTFTNDELADHLAETHYTDVELRALADAEAAGKERDGALEAINDARNAAESDSDE